MLTTTFRLRDRVLLLLLLVLLPFAALTFVTVEYRLREQAEVQLTDELVAARGAFEEIRRQWRTELTQSAVMISELPYFKAAAAVYDPSASRVDQIEQVNTIEPVARSIMETLGLDFLALTDPRGNVVLALQGGNRLAASWLGGSFRSLGRTVDSEGVAAGLLEVGGQIEQTVMVPMSAGGVEFGRLAIGRRLDDALAGRIQRMTHAEVSILGTHRPLARCCGSADLMREVELFSLHRHGTTRAALVGEPVMLSLAGERFLTLWTPFEDPDGRPIGSFVLHSSLDQALAYVETVRQTMLVLWLAALLAAIVLSLHASRQLTKPIDGLVTAAGRVAAGDFTARVSEDGAEELRHLAGTFNQMSTGLEESHRQLAEYNQRLMERTQELEENHLHLLRSTELLEESNRELREMHAQLIQASKMAAFGELGAGVAHELSQPLTSLKGFAQLALARMSEDDVNRPHLNRIIQAVDHMTRIVSSLKNFARMSQFESREVHVNDVLEETTVFLSAQFRRHQIRFSLDCESELPDVLGDANQLQQVFTNLLANARDALEGRENGEVRLSTRSRFRGRYVVVRVADNGPGIPPDLKPKIFRTFFTTKDAGKGTGLGLSISRGIVQDHGGRLGVHSRPAGGACFYIVLPGAQAAGRAAA
jgi:signal transduction histidine kinase